MPLLRCVVIVVMVLAAPARAGGDFLSKSSISFHNENLITYFTTSIPCRGIWQFTIHSCDDALTAKMWGLVGATLTVAATTIDDAVWLVTYVSSEKLSLHNRVLHMAIFVGILEGLAVLCCLFAQAVHALVGDKEDWIFGLMGAILCWLIAGALYVKKMLKRRRRQQETLEPVSEGYDAILPQEEDEPTLSFDPWTVVSMTFLGALDEISYFPALLVGHVFTQWQLLLGTLLAACIILIVIMTFLAQCRPLMEWLDGIPLYGIVSMFATILTIGVLIDLWKDKQS
jgi:cadmium resistance protein CadD (predicted permease)